MTIRVAAKVNYSSGGRIGIGNINIVDNQCSTTATFDIVALGDATGWVEFVEDPDVTVLGKASGYTINGGDTEQYTVIIDFFRSTSDSLNIVNSSFVMSLKDVIGGTTLDTFNVSRFHTPNFC